MLPKLLLLLAALTAFGQTAAFEAADVKPNKSGEARMAVDFQPGGRFVARNVPMRVLIAMAYRVRPEYVKGPDWIASERFDIVAKAVLPADLKESPDVMRDMVKSLLAERFKLAVHSEKQEMPAYALLAARSGSKLQASQPAPPNESRCAPGTGAANEKHVVCRHIPMSIFAELLQELAPRDLQSPVVNLTGLEGSFDFNLDWTPRAGVAAAESTAVDDLGPSLFTAVEKQLGLKLESRKLPLPVIMVDFAERTPSEN